MSQTGNLIFYAVRDQPKPTEVITAALDWARVGKVHYIVRTRGESHEWLEFVNDDGGPGDDSLKYESVSDIPNLFIEGRCLSLYSVESPQGARISDAIEANIPVEVRGMFCPGDLFIRVGHHDLFECSEYDEGVFIARTMFSVGVFGYSTPNNWGDMRRLVLGLPEIQLVQNELQELAGPMEHCIYWSV